MQDINLFVGAFHPILVHLPIGVLIAAVLLHVLSLSSRFSGLYKAVPWLYGVAALGAIGAVVSGWLLAGPLGAHWDIHRYWGLGTMVGLVLMTWLTASKKTSKKGGAILGVIALGACGWAGHLGGELTHGAGHFVQYAPSAFAKTQEIKPALALASRDSVIVFQDLIQPIFTQKCVACHRADLAHGSLRMDSYAALQKGGSEGDAIASKELWRRVSLPPDHPRYMPSRGEPLSYDELLIVKSWLNAASDSMSTVSDWKPDEEVIKAIARTTNLDVRELPYIDRARPAAIALDDVPPMWSIQPISQQHTTVEAKLIDVNVDASVALKALEPYAANITILDLRQVDNADSWLAALPPMVHLTKLDLSRSDATAVSLSRLSQYPHLETVNLSGTQVKRSKEDVLAMIPESVTKLYGL